MNKITFLYTTLTGMFAYVYLYVTGGASGSSESGSGGGGRITLEVASTYNHTGGIIVSAGPGQHAGGSGTAFVTLTKLNAPYTILIVDNSHANDTEPAQTHFSEGDSQEFVFHEMHVTNGADVVFHGAGISVVAKTLVCSVESVIRVPDGVNLTIDDSMQETVIPCSLDVAPDGELRVPQKVTFLGPDNQLAGMYYTLSTHTIFTGNIYTF